MNAKSVIPLPGYITLKLIDPETKTASGLDIPDTAQEKPQLGKVLAVGRIYKETILKNNVENSLEAVKLLQFQNSVEEGDIVAFKKYTGNPVKIEDGEVQIVEFKDLLGVVK